VRILDPLALTWFAALALPVVLYLVRPRARRQRVSTLLFFKSLAREHQESAWLRRLKRLLSLLLTLIVIAAAVLAIARPVMSPPAGAVRSVVILIDRSASMAAKDSRGHTRVDDAKHAALARLAGLPSGTAVSVVAYDSRPAVMLPRSYDRREMVRAIESIAPRPISGLSTEAIQFAKQLAEIDAPTSIWHFTDAVAADTPTASEASAIDHVCVALPAPTNVGVTAFEIRRSPMQRGTLEAFAQLVATGPSAVEAQVSIRRNKQLIALRQLTIEAGGHEHVIMPLKAGRVGDVLSLDVTTANDALALDDHVLARVPPIEPIDVAWISRDPDAVTQFALQSLGQDTHVRVFAGGPDAWPTDKPVDVVVFQGWLPETWPTDVAVIAIDPDRSLGPIHLAPIAGSGLPVESPRVTRGQHPVLYGVAAGRVSLLQKTVLDSDPARSGLEPLWVGPAGPLLAVGEVHGQRLVILPFSAVESENLWRLPSYPLLIGNAIYWATQPKIDTLTGNNRRAGELIATTGTRLTWSGPGSTGADAAPTPITGKWAELDRIGLWSTDAGDQGSASLLSASETRLPAAPAQITKAAMAVGNRWLVGDLTVPLLWLVFATLLVESSLFHRHAVS
jgi:hypothetical protein